MKRVIGMAALSLVLISQPAWASRTPVHEAAESQEYGRKAGGMIGRGVINITTCFVDPIVSIAKETRDGPPIVGTLSGLGKGLGCGALRLGSGAVDLVTFWVPGFNGFPVSDSYDNCFGGASSSASMEMPESTPPTSTWEVPTTEPGAAQPPPPAEHPKKRWTK